MGDTLSCERFEIYGGAIASTHFPVHFESLMASINFRGGDGSDDVSIVVLNRQGVKVGRGAVPLTRLTLRFNFTVSFDLLARVPGPYIAQLVTNGKAIKEAEFYVHQTPSIPQSGSPS